MRRKGNEPRVLTPGGTYSVAETAAFLGVNRTTVYRLGDLDYVYDAEGHRAYIGFSIMKRKNTYTDPRTGRAVMVDRDGRVTPVDGGRRKTNVKQSF